MNKCCDINQNIKLTNYKSYFYYIPFKALMLFSRSRNLSDLMANVNKYDYKLSSEKVSCIICKSLFAKSYFRAHKDFYLVPEYIEDIFKRQSINGTSCRKLIKVDGAIKTNKKNWNVLSWIKRK